MHTSAPSSQRIYPWDKYMLPLALWRVYKSRHTAGFRFHLTHFLCVCALIMFAPAQPWLWQDEGTSTFLPLPYMDWMLRRWFGFASYQPLTLGYWAPRLCVFTMFHLGVYVAACYFVPDGPKSSRMLPCVERDCRTSEKISSLPFQPEKPLSVDPVESGDHNLGGRRIKWASRWLAITRARGACASTGPRGDGSRRSAFKLGRGARDWV